MLLVTGAWAAGRLRAQSEFFNSVGVHRLEQSKSGLKLSGRIGPTLAQDLRIQLSGRPGWVVLEIDNLGGSLEAALQAFDYLKARGRVITRLVGRCASACVAVLAAGARRESLVSGEIGVHRGIDSSSGIDIDDDKRYIAALQHAGISDVVIRAARETSNDSMTWFQAALYPEDVRLGIVDSNGLSIGDGPAVFRYYTNLIRDEGGASGSIRHAANVIDLSVELVQEYATSRASEMRDAIRDGNADAIEVIVKQLTDTAASEALRFGDSISIRYMIEQQYAVIVEAGHDASSCSRPTEKHLDTFLSAREELFKSGLERRAAGARPHVVGDVVGLIEEVRREREVLAIPDEELDPLSPRALCTFQRVLLPKLLASSDEELPTLVAGLQ